MKHLWLNTVLNRPWLILLIGMLLITAATMGGKNLYFRGDYKVFFDDDNPQLTAFEHMQSTFNKNENAAIIIAPKSGNVFSKETLTLIKNMTDQAWLTPNSSRVDSITNYQHTWAQEDDLIVEDLVPDLETIDQQTIARAREVALKEPNLVKRMVSEKGHVAVINITVQLPDADTPKTALDTSIAVNDITGFIIKMTEEYKAQYPDHDFYHTGIVFMS
ncbi:MAG: RND family transporter, partial [Bacteroidota bacterium]